MRICFSYKLKLMVSRFIIVYNLLICYANIFKDWFTNPILIDSRFAFSVLDISAMDVFTPSYRTFCLRIIIKIQKIFLQKQKTKIDVVLISRGFVIWKSYVQFWHTFQWCVLKEFCQLLHAKKHRIETETQK